MKVTFTCEKCGHVEYPSVIAADKHGRVDINEFTQRPCPNCAKLTYGPLTEEMVSEALYSAMQLRPSRGFAPVHWWEASDGLKDDFRRQARFVLRLLEWVHAYEDAARIRDDQGGKLPYYSWSGYAPAREKLLDIARMK